MSVDLLRLCQEIIKRVGLKKRWWARRQEATLREVKWSWVRTIVSWSEVCGSKSNVNLFRRKCVLLMWSIRRCEIVRISSPQKNENVTLNTVPQPDLAYSLTCLLLWRSRPHSRREGFKWPQQVLHVAGNPQATQLVILAQKWLQTMQSC